VSEGGAARTVGCVHRAALCLVRLAVVYQHLRMRNQFKLKSWPGSREPPVGVGQLRMLLTCACTSASAASNSSSSPSTSPSSSSSASGMDSMGGSLDASALEAR
jgi:hypothetical protein